MIHLLHVKASIFSVIKKMCVQKNSFAIDSNLFHYKLGLNWSFKNISKNTFNRENKITLKIKLSEEKLSPRKK